MSAPIWVTPAGFLGTLTERVTTSSVLVATGSNIRYDVISGNLPVGLYLNTATAVIQGTPTSVPSDINTSFVVRASNSDGLRDRTFILSVTGPTTPIWSTPQGLLPAGINGEYYTFNKEYVDYQLRAETDILSSGNFLKYFIGDNQGMLPPGLTLTQHGRIYGFISDTLTLDWQASESGGFDTERYDAYPYDHSLVNVNVVDLYKPTSVNKIYQFKVTVTDGIISEKRLFSIEVTDANSLRADTSFIGADTLNYDTSIGYLLSPIWISASGNLLPKVTNLGVVRASRKQVITLHDYDPYPFVGPVTWDWSSTINPEIKIVTDSRFNLIGRPTQNKHGNTAVYFKDTTIFPVKGMKLRLDEYVEGYDNTTYTITGVIPTGLTSGYLNLDKPLVNSSHTLDKNLPDSRVIYVGTPSIHPNGLSLDPKTGELYGIIPYQPAFSQSYRFTIRVIKTDTQTGLTTYADQIFILTIKGDIDSFIQYISPSSLGVLFPGQISELSVVAQNVHSNSSVIYEIVGGILPPGLTLNDDGSIQGTVDYGKYTTFDSGILTIDQNTTTIDKNWYITVRASDVYHLSSIEQTFNIAIEQNSSMEYTRIFIKPFLSPTARNAYRNFITNDVTFDRSLLYRPEDPEFGVQQKIKMVIETGIQKLPIENFVAMLQNSFYRKKFYFGDVKSTPATDVDGNIVYELIYIDIIDEQMMGKYSPLHAATVGNIQSQLESIILDSGATISVDERLQPRYMTTLQSNGIPLGFIKAVPICYVLPGSSAKILSRITASNFDFKQIFFDTDRVVIETPFETTESTWIFYPTTRQ